MIKMERIYNKLVRDKIPSIIEGKGEIPVIRALACLENKSLDDVICIANKKSEKRGAFCDKIFLEKVIDVKSN